LSGVCFKISIRQEKEIGGEKEGKEYLVNNVRITRSSSQILSIKNVGTRLSGESPLQAQQGLH
jgi:hypothetical protein